MLRVEKISDASEVLIYINKGKQKGTPMFDFKAECIEYMNKLVKVFLKQIDEFEKDDLYLLKNTILVYKAYVKDIEIKSKTYQPMQKELEENFNKLMETKLVQEIMKPKTK